MAIQTPKISKYPILTGYRYMKRLTQYYLFKMLTPVFDKSIINLKRSNIQNNYIKLGNILYTKNWLCLHLRVRETLCDNLPPNPADHETLFRKDALWASGLPLFLP